MRVIFEITRVFTVFAAVGLMIVGSGCAKPENGGGEAAPASDLGEPEAGSTTGGGAEVPEGAHTEGEGDAAAEGEGDAAGTEE